MIGLRAPLFLGSLSTALENFMLFKACYTLIGKRENVYMQLSSKSVFKPPSFSLKPQSTALRIHFIYLVINLAENPLTQSMTYLWYVKSPWKLPLKGFITFASLTVCVAHMSDGKRCLDLMLRSISLSITDIRGIRCFWFPKSHSHLWERSSFAFLMWLLISLPGRACILAEKFCRVGVFVCLFSGANLPGFKDSVHDTGMISTEQ